MDNYLESSPTAEVIRKAKDLVKWLSLGGFKLTKFVSNVPTIPTSPIEGEEIPSIKNTSHVMGQSGTTVPTPS